MRLIVQGYLTDTPPATPDVSVLLSGGWGVCGVQDPEGSVQLWGTVVGKYENVVTGCLGWERLFYVMAGGAALRSIPLPAGGGEAGSEAEVVALPQWTRVEQLSAGEGHVLCVMEDGSVWSCGENRNGCLGIQSRDASTSLNCVLGPCCEEMDPLAREAFRQVACGMVHSCAVSERGTVFCWGCNLHGECGQISKEDVLTPKQVECMGGLDVCCVSAGIHHSMALTKSGDLYGWGSNADTQLCLSHRIASSIPALVDTPLLENEHLIKVSCGARHTVAMSREGRAFGWGWNAFRQVSQQVSQSCISEPIEIYRDCIDVSTGHWHSMFLKAS